MQRDKIEFEKKNQQKTKFFWGEVDRECKEIK
jgi:hypothetical protein